MERETERELELRKRKMKALVEEAGMDELYLWQEEAEIELEDRKWLSDFKRRENEIYLRVINREIERRERQGI